MTPHPSIREDYLISMIDGAHYVLLKRHIKTHGYTVESYKAEFGLPDDYPMIPPAYSRRRSEMSKKLDFSRRWNPNTNRRRGDTED